MARCMTCAAETQLYVSGSPLCIACYEKNEAVRKPPQSYGGEFTESNATLIAAREAYRRALQAQLEASKLKESMEPDNADRNAALLNANRELDLASAKYDEALREFIARTGMRRRSG
jgi:hypothetical protein